MDRTVENCPANTVKGSALAVSNEDGVVIVDNTVSGDVTPIANTGGATGVVVSGNHR